MADQQKYEGWGVDLMDWIGKAIPNEVSKLNSYSDWLNYIPMIGPALNYGMKGISGLDAGFTNFSDTGNWDLLGEGIMGGIQGESQDPGMYGSGYNRTGVPSYNQDWANIAGQVGEYLPSLGNMGSWAGILGEAGNLGSALSNPYWANETTSQMGDYVTQGVPAAKAFSSMISRSPSQAPIDMTQGPNLTVGQGMNAYG